MTDPVVEGYLRGWPTAVPLLRNNWDSTFREAVSRDLVASQAREAAAMKPAFTANKDNVLARARAEAVARGDRRAG